MSAALEALENAEPDYGITDIIPFGKHKGAEVCTVIQVDPTYIQWALNNVRGFSLDQEAQDYHDDIMNAQRECWDGYEEDSMDQGDFY